MAVDKKLTPRNIAMIAVTIGFFAFQMYLALIKQLPPMLQSPMHLFIALSIVYLYYPANKGREHNKWLLAIDIPCYAGIAFLFFYIATQHKMLINHVPFIDPVTRLDVAAMVVTLVLLLLAVRRTLGKILFYFIIAFIVYAWAAPYCPGILYTKGKAFALMLKQFTEGMTMGESGVFGTPLYTSASSLFYFIVFGVFFSECGGGQLLIDCGMKFSNKSSGGPAKAAVISSCLMGMISGSAVANVSTTGVMTIPMMKKVGYAPHEAGAIEAVASTGGQIMPPIMGVGAFIMAEMLGVSYLFIAKSAILPALAYYVGVFVLVTMLARKRAVNSTGVDTEIKVEQPIFQRLYLLAPAIILVMSLIQGASLMRAGMIGIFSCLACNIISYFVNGRRNYIGISELAGCCMRGAKQAADIAIPTAACGIIINVVTGQTSLATNLTRVVGALGSSRLFLALFIAMIGCMLLGMALPTVAAYLVGVILFVPVIRSLGVDALCANMFVFYFGIMAQITPPVCVASYTAAGIAGADAMKTGLTGMSYATVGFMVPFVFVYNPAILLQGTAFEIVLGATQLMAGTFLLACSVAGFYRIAMRPYERVLLFSAACCLIIPEVISTIVGIILGIAILGLNATRHQKEGARGGVV